LSSTNGSGIFGKAGKGQIIVDPTQNKALLYSGNFWKNYDASKGLPTAYDTSNYNGAGLLVDLTTPQIVFGNGNFKVDEHGWLTAKGGGSIAGWTIGTTTLSSKNGTITLNSDNSAITFKNSSGKMYSGSHNGLKSTAAGFYISDDGLSIGSKFKVTSDGTLEIGNGATTSSSKHWTINGDGARSYISYGGSSYDKYFIAANINTTNKNQVYIGTDGISLGRRFSVSSSGSLIAREGLIANWTIRPGSITYGTNEDTLYPKNKTGIYFGTGGIRLGSTFSVTSGGYLTCSGALVSGTLSSEGGTFNNITANGGQFNNITANGGQFNNINVSGNSILNNVKINGALDVSGQRAYKWETATILTNIKTKKAKLNIGIPTSLESNENGWTGGFNKSYFSTRYFVYALERYTRNISFLSSIGAETLGDNNEYGPNVISREDEYVNYW